MSPICFIICINYCILFSKHISCCFLFSQFLTSLLITFSISGVFWHSVIIWHLSTILHQYFIILSYLKRPIYYRASTLHFKLSPTFDFLYARSLRFKRVLTSNFVETFAIVDTFLLFQFSNLYTLYLNILNFFLVQPSHGVPLKTFKALPEEQKRWPKPSTCNSFPLSCVLRE